MQELTQNKKIKDILYKFSSCQGVLYFRDDACKTAFCISLYLNSGSTEEQVRDLNSCTRCQKIVWDKKGRYICLHYLLIMHNCYKDKYLMILGK